MIKRNNKHITLYLLLAALAGCTTGANAPVTDLYGMGPDSRGYYTGGDYHEVKKGDTLYFIAYLSNQDVRELIRLNNLSEPYTIYPGQKIKLKPTTYQDNNTIVSDGSAIQMVNTGIIKEVDVITPSTHSVNQTINTDNVNNKTSDIVNATNETLNDKATSVTSTTPSVSINTPVSTSSSVSKNTSTIANIPVGTAPEVIVPEVTVSTPEIKTPSTSSNSVNNTVAKIPNKNVSSTTSKEYSSAQSDKNVNIVDTVASGTSGDKVSKWLWPTQGTVVREFSSGDQGNKGIDIAGKRGQAILATASGSVVYSGNALRGYGNLVIIKHNDDYLSAYAHNDKLLVKEGQSVGAGQKIATMGSTGATSVGLHFEIRYRGTSVNPKRYLP